MVGGVQACGRVAAVALLAMGSVVPFDGPVVTSTVAEPMAGSTDACTVTVGTATTDPALAADAARAVAAGFLATDCMPDPTALAAAEARAAIPMGSGTADGATGATTGTSAGALSTAASGGIVVPTATPPPTTTPTTTPPTTTAAPAAGTGTTTTSATDASTTDTSTTGTTTTGTTTSDDDGDSTNDGSTNDAAGDDSTGDSDDDGSSGDSTDDGDRTPDDGSPDDGSSDDGSDDGSSDDGSVDDGSVDDGSTGGVVAADGTTTAAGKLGWGTAARAEDFDGDLSAWSLYDGVGHAGKGRRSPDAIAVSQGILTITGDPTGTTGGMSWGNGTQYGRWEARVKSPAGDPTYNAVMLLWPDAENWPVGGEVDFMEIGDETRQKTDFFLHYGADNRQLHGEVQVDATQWHNWAVEWSPTTITAYVDGQVWYTTTRTEAFPPGPMHLTLQLDWFPKGGGTVRQSAMHVDWVRYYPVDGTGDSGTIQNSLAATSDTGNAFVDTRSGTSATGGEVVESPVEGGSDDEPTVVETDTGPVVLDPDPGVDPGTDPDDTSVAGTTTSATTSLAPEPDDLTDDPGAAEGTDVGDTGDVGTATIPTGSTTTPPPADLVPVATELVRTEAVGSATTTTTPADPEG